MPQSEVALSVAKIKINGSNAQPDFFRDLDWVEVDDSLYLPAMCTIRLADPSLEWVDSEKLKIGAEIEVALSAGGAEGNVFKGEVTSIEPEFTPDEFSSVLIRCYDKSHRLMRKRSSRTFLEMSDSDIVKKIVGESGLGVQADSTATVHEFLLQDNLSDYEFLQQRARYTGCIMKMDGPTLKFKKRSAFSDDAPDLRLGVELFEFRPRLTGVSQPDSVQVKGWDYKKKQVFVGQASSSALVPKVGSDAGHTAANRAFGATGPWAVAGLPSAGQSDADGVAQAILDVARTGDVHAFGVAFGDPRLLAGKYVTVKDIGTRFGGKYFITRARHRWETRGSTGYRTYLETSNGTGETAADLVTRSAVPTGHTPPTQRLGVAIGIVTNNNDPENLGRVKVKLPWLGEIETSWVRVAMPMTGSSIGTLFLPSVNDEVVVAYEGGNPEHPIVIGSLWNGLDKPPLNASETAKGGITFQRIIKTKAGHKIIINDDEQDPSIQFIDETGKNKILIETKGESGSGLITVEAESKVLVKAKNVYVDAAEMVDIKSDRQVHVKSSQVKVEADTTMELTASGSMKIDGGSVLELKGGTVKIN